MRDQAQKGWYSHARHIMWHNGTIECLFSPHAVPVAHWNFFKRIVKCGYMVCSLLHCLRAGWLMLFAWYSLVRWFFFPSRICNKPGSIECVSTILAFVFHKVYHPRPFCLRIFFLFSQIGTHYSAFLFKIVWNHNLNCYRRRRILFFFVVVVLNRSLSLMLFKSCAKCTNIFFRRNVTLWIVLS